MKSSEGESYVVWVFIDDWSCVIGGILGCVKDRVFLLLDLIFERFFFILLEVFLCISLRCKVRKFLN